MHACLIICVKVYWSHCSKWYQ